MNRINALIIDDEKNGRENLRNMLLKHCPQIHILAEADSVSSGLQAIKTHSPQLIFLDIEMPDGDGFYLLEKSEKINFEIIFVTAYNHYAIKAFKFSAVDYLLKPINSKELTSAIERAEQRLAIHQPQRVKTLLENTRTKTSIEKISLPTANGYIFVNLHDIIRCQSDNNYTWFYFKNGKKTLITRTLKEYEELLAESGFYRIHQSHLINKLHIQQYVKGDNARFILSDKSAIPVAQRKKEMVKEILRQIP